MSYSIYSVLWISFTVEGKCEFDTCSTIRESDGYIHVHVQTRLVTESNVIEVARKGRGREQGVASTAGIRNFQDEHKVTVNSQIGTH